MMKKEMGQIPCIIQKGNRKVLMVNGKEFIMLAGEVHNSNSSDISCMEQVWDQAENLAMNTLLLPVSWEMIEPEEGRFEFRLLDRLIWQARNRGGKLGLLWFGSWKNAQCYYAPEWVKADVDRFKRAQVIPGRNFCRLKDFYDMPYTSLSCFCKETMEADARAFAAMMAHLREVDGEENTVITVQVENETGIMGSPRERSEEADTLFEGEVPEEFVRYMKEHMDLMDEGIKTSVQSGASSGSWREVFGKDAEELFSAYYIAGYVNVVAKAGKKEYPLPMTVNCWLDKGQNPGEYPSGGPVAKVMEVWKYRAPEIDIFSADIYVKDFIDICDKMTGRFQNPLYIPECATHSYAGPREVYCIGHYHAMCYAPFGFEDMGKPFTGFQSVLFGVDTEDAVQNTPQDTGEYRWYNETLQSMMPRLTEAYGSERLQAVSAERKEADTMLFGTFGFRIFMDIPMLSRKDGVCLILQEQEDTFFIMGNACMITFFSQDPKRPNAEIFFCEEGHFEKDRWKKGRRLNGDEVAVLMMERPGLLKLKLHAFS